MRNKPGACGFDRDPRELRMCAMSQHDAHLPGSSPANNPHRIRFVRSDPEMNPLEASNTTYCNHVHCHDTSARRCKVHGVTIPLHVTEAPLVV